MQERTLACSRSAEAPGAGNRGVFFDVQNAGAAAAVLITGLVGGARGYGGPREATLYACREAGSGAGRETGEAQWRAVGRATLQKNTSTALRLDAPLTIAPGATQGFLLYSARDGVRYSEENPQTVSDGVLRIAAGRWTNARTPFGTPGANNYMYTHAGAVVYAVL